MHIVHSFEELAGVAHRVFLAIGVFDGVHVGHQQVIGRARDDARAAGGASVVLTFDPHPMRVLQPEKAPRLLTATPHKLRLIGALGVDACLVVAFDAAFAQIPPEQFVELVAHQTDQLQEVCVGTRFRFGHRRTGDVRLIEKLGAAHGFAVREIKPVEIGGHIVSSTAIRQQILTGHLDRAAAMLGRPCSVLGTVVAGDGVGRALGCPTANLNPHNEALPPDGVYAARVILGAEAHDAKAVIPSRGRRVPSPTEGSSRDLVAGVMHGKSEYHAVVNIGVRPTFADRPPRRVIETHLLDFQEDLYSRDLEILFLQKIREEKKFAGPDELKRQIAADVLAAKKILAGS